MTSSQVRCFLAAAKYLSFTKAAEELFLSQPGLSRQISALENELGVCLFERGRNSIKLTKAGETCKEYCLRIMNEYQNMTDSLMALKDGYQAPLIIAAMEGQMVGKCYEDALSWFWINRPQTELRMCYYPASKLSSALLDGTIDIAIMAETEVKNLPNIAWKRARKDRCCLVVPKNHPKANKENPSLFDFEDETFLILEEDDSLAISKQHRGVMAIPGFVPKKQHLVPTYGTLSTLLEMGAGISVLNKWHSLRNAPHLSFLEVPEIGHRIEVVAWREGNTNQNVIDFLNLIHEVNEDD